MMHSIVVQSTTRMTGMVEHTPGCVSDVLLPPSSGGELPVLLEYLTCEWDVSGVERYLEDPLRIAITERDNPFEVGGRNR